MTLAVPRRDELAPPLRFLAGGGDASRLILDRDWADHPLGPPTDWPDTLKVSLGLVLNSPESMIFCWGRDDLFFFFNTAYFPLLGPRLAWAMGTPFRDVWADAWAQAQPIIADAFEGRSQRFTDLPWKLDTDRGPADTWFTFSYSRILGTDGEIAGLFVFTNETTERVLADRALQDSQTRLSLLNATLEQEVAQRTADRDLLWRLSADMMVVASVDGVMESVNPAWTRTLGWAQSELIGLPVFDLVHPDDLERTAAIVAAIAAGESIANVENRYRHKDGSYRDLSWAAGPGDGKIVGVARDQTEEKQRATALAQAEEQLRQAQKMEAVGQLTGGIAHDFNNMLTGVIGSLDLLKRQLAAGKLDRADRYIDAATTSAQRAAGLTHRLLAFSRRQSLDVKRVDVDALVGGMADLLRRTLGEGIALEVVADARAWPAQTDQNQLESALLNLAINARDAMPDGGRLTIATTNVTLDEPDVVGIPGARGDFVAVVVTDTGEGMSEATIEHAFEPFFTTKPIGTGTGLGLSMIYGFARQSGGHVRIASQLGEGTTVTLYLPRANRRASDAPATAPGGPAETARPGEQVLLVEDDPAVRMLVGDVLADLGYGVREARDGPEALTLLAAMDRLDLLVTDVGLPGMNGRQLADVARERRPDLRVLFITGYAERAAVRGAFLAPGMDMIAKPFAIDTLAAKVRAMLNG